ncbi:MAG: iron-containing alcohol dehydrogenase [bacterium]
MLPEYYEFHCPTKILSGRKALPNIPHELAQRGASKPMVVTDKGIVKAGLLDHLKAALAGSRIGLDTIFDAVPVDSSNRVVNQAAEAFRQGGCDSFIAVGGGSVIDTAKGANIVVSEGSNDLLEFQGVDRLRADMKPLVVVPTTAGTGSEVTPAAIIYNEETGLKMAFMSGRLSPHVAVIDPVMTLTMPAGITAATGMDALTHAIEAFTCLQKNPVSDAFATKAIELVFRHLVDAVETPKDQRVRLGMANAALLAGIAFSNSMVGLVHSLAHATGGVCHVPHGVANGIFLPWVMAYNLARIPNLLAQLGALLGADEKGAELERAQFAIEKVRDLQLHLKRLTGLPTNLREAGVSEEKLEAIAEAAMNDGAVTYNPEEADRNDMLSLLRKAY